MWTCALGPENVRGQPEFHSPQNVDGVSSPPEKKPEDYVVPVAPELPAQPIEIPELNA